jgi:hypothetical protein
MKPVNVNATDILGELAAASQIAFGAAVIHAAAGTIKSTLNTVDNVIGIAGDDNVEKTIDGFYSQYDMVPVVRGGRNRLWITSNEAAKEDIEAGDFLEVAILGGGGVAQPIGAFQQMGAEGGTCTGAVRELRSVAQALESMTMTDIEPVAVAVAVGDTTITMASGDMTNLDLAAGDYILLEDHDGDAMINRVKSVTSTVITLQIASTVALADTTDDDIHKLHQVEARFL